MTTTTIRIGCQIKTIKKNCILDTLGTPHIRPSPEIVTIIQNQDSMDWSHLHTTLSHTASTMPTARYQTTGGASSRLSRKELIASYLL